MTPTASHAKPYWDPAKQLRAPTPHGTVGSCLLLTEASSSTPSPGHMQKMPPNETSPLLPKPLQTVSPHPIAEDSSIAPDDPYEHGPDDVDGDQLERQPSNGDASLHQGMPEVRKRMKYIFPAICIGVCTSSISRIDTRLTYPGLPLRRRPDPRRVYLRHNRDRAQSP